MTEVIPASISCETFDPIDLTLKLELCFFKDTYEHFCNHPTQQKCWTVDQQANQQQQQQKKSSVKKTIAYIKKSVCPRSIWDLSSFQSRQL